MGGSGVWAPLLGKFGGFEGEEVGVKVVDIDMGILKVRGSLTTPIHVYLSAPDDTRMEGA